MPSLVESNEYAIDFDGDDKIENQFGNLVKALTGIGLNIQDIVNQEVNAGRNGLFFTVDSEDTEASSCARWSISRAEHKSPANPRYDGDDKFGSLEPIGRFHGTISRSKFYAAYPNEQEAGLDQVIYVVLPMPFTLNPTDPNNFIVVPLRGVHIEGRFLKNAQKVPIISKASSVGVLHGVIYQQTINDNIIPTIAQRVTAAINTNCDAKATLISLFEKSNNPVSMKKCAANSNDCCSMFSATCRILPEEVRASVVGQALKCDIQAFDNEGKWAPVPGGATKNGMTVGIGFTAIRAKL